MEEGERGPFSAAFGGRERAPVKVSHESMNLSPAVSLPPGIPGTDSGVLIFLPVRKTIGTMHGIHS